MTRSPARCWAFLILGARLLTASPAMAQTETDAREEIRANQLEYWLNRYTLSTDAEAQTLVTTILNRLLTVADLNSSSFPQAYVFKNLEMYQTHALADASIIVPEKVLRFCGLDPEWRDARIAFILAHELNHIFEKHYARFDSADSLFEKMGFLTQGMAKKLKTELHLQLEFDADKFGILYTLLAGFDIAAITADFLESFYRASYGEESLPRTDRERKLVQKRLEAIGGELKQIREKLDLFHIGVALYTIEKYAEAKAVFNAFLQFLPSKEVFNNLGMCAFQQAISILNSCRNLEDDFAKQGRSDVLRYRFAMQINADIHVVGMRAFQEGCVDRFKELLKEARGYFEEAKQRDDLDEVILNNLAGVYLFQNEEHLAKAYFYESIESNPLYAPSRNNFALVSLFSRDTTKAKTHLLAALQVSPDMAEAHFNLATLLLASGDSRKAREHANKYLALDAFSSDANSMRAILNQKTPVRPRNAVNPLPEVINGLAAGHIFRMDSKKWKSLRLPRAKIYVKEQRDEHVKLYVYEPVASANNPGAGKKIAFIQTLPGYDLATAQGVKIGSRQGMIQGRYAQSIKRISAQGADFLRLQDSGIVFECREEFVRGWMLFKEE